jgi:hypothetical protein
MPIAHGIGIISSIRYAGTNLEANFKRGVGNDAWCNAAAPTENLGYGVDGALRTAVINFNGNAAVGLIVTVGGLVSAVSALKYSTKPFLSLIGGKTPQFSGAITGRFYGGVNLHTFNDNDTRFTYLTTHKGFLPSQICLLSNPNSSMAPVETGAAQWPSPPRGRVIQASTDAEISNAFVSFRNDANLRAMIVSADPFFQDDKQNLINAANGSGKYVCYPLQIYANTGGTHQPNAGQHTKHGPSLATEYYNLGVKANSVITHDRASTLDDAGTQVDPP